MKKLVTSALLAMTGLAFMGPAAQASLTYSPDDLLLSVRQTGSTTDYVIDLGSASLYTTGGANATGDIVTIGNFGADLSSLFGAGGTWATTNGSTTFWSIVGTAGNALVSGGKTAQGEYVNTLFASVTEGTPGTQSSTMPAARASNSTQATPQSKLSTFGGNANTGANGNTAGLAANSVIQDSNTNPSSYLAFTPGASPFSYFNSTTTENTFSKGTGLGGATSDLYRLTATSPVGNGVTPAAGQTFVGAFNFDSAGNLRFSSDASDFAAIPEPSTYVLMGLGCLAIMFRFRRFRAVANS